MTANSFFNLQIFDIILLFLDRNLQQQQDFDFGKNAERIGTS